MAQTPWWKGNHGEWYVVAQVALIALVFFGPRNITVWSSWTAPFTWLGSIGGSVILSTGILLSHGGDIPDGIEFDRCPVSERTRGH